MKKITTRSGRVYLLDQEHRKFLRVGAGEMPGQWFENETWVHYSSATVEVGKPFYALDRGPGWEPDLWIRTSPVVSVEES